MEGIQNEVYNYIMEKAGCHYMERHGLYSAHITLGYDYQKFANGAWEAKDTLARYLVSMPHIVTMVQDILEKRKKIAVKVYYKELSKEPRVAQLQQLTSLTQDGDIIDKTMRDELVKDGYARRIASGWNYITSAGVYYLETNKHIHH